VSTGRLPVELCARSNVRNAHNDSERRSKICGLVGCACLILLNEIDMAGLLKADVWIRDLDLVIRVMLE
jgi:hypothetical protein